MIQFRVVIITNNLEKYPQFREDTEEFLDLVVYIEDEIEVLVIDTRDGGSWPANEFFDITNVRHFIVDSSEAPK